MTRIALIVGVVGYLVGFFAPAGIEPLVMDPAQVRGGEVWRLLTYPPAVLSIWNLLFGLLIFWTCGAEMELYWGSRRYAAFLLVSTLAGGLLGFVLSFLGGQGAAGAVPGHGIGGLVTAVIVAWALLGPRLPTSFWGVLPMSRGGFAIIALIFAFFGTFERSRSLPLLGCVLGGVPVAWFFSRRAGGRGAGSPPMRLPRLLRRRRFRVVRGDGDDGYRFH